VARKGLGVVEMASFKGDLPGGSVGGSDLASRSMTGA